LQILSLLAHFGLIFRASILLGPTRQKRFPLLPCKISKAEAPARPSRQPRLDLLSLNQLLRDVVEPHRIELAIDRALQPGGMLGWNIPHVAAFSGHRSWASLKRYTHIRQSGDKYAGRKWLKVATTPIENMRLTTKGNFPRRQRSDRAETVPFLRVVGE
jgi:hypothetical protein